MTHQPVPHPRTQPTVWEELPESNSSAVVPVHSQSSQTRCTHHLKLPAHAGWMTSRKWNSKSETRASFPMTDMLGHVECLWGTPTLHWPTGCSEQHLVCLVLLYFFPLCIAKKSHILNKDENLLLLKSTCNSLQGSSEPPMKYLLVFWPPVVWDIQKICATSAGTFKWPCVAPGTVYTGLIKIYSPGKWELIYLANRPASSIIWRQCVPLSSFLPDRVLSCWNKTLSSA